MKRVRFVTIGALPLVLVLSAAPGPAQGQRPNRPVATEQEKLRLQIAAMEGVLATAVHEIHSQQLERIVPGLVQLDATVRARGFQLEGYGVFFDVDLPPLPRTVEWTLRVLGSPVRLDFELGQLRRQLAAVPDPRLRREIEQTVRTIQRKVENPGFGTVQGEPAGQGALTGGATVQATSAEGPQPREDPFAAYARELGVALADLMVQYGGTISMRPDDWLTVAARESQPRLLPGGPAQTALTLRVKGADLAAFKAGRLSADEARRKVEIKEF